MSVYAFGPYQLDAERLLLLESGEPVALGPKVVETLLALLEHPGETLAKTALLDRVWPEGYVEEANLAQNIYVLRKALRAHWAVDAIETVPRRGYRFREPVRLIEPVRSEPTHEIAALPARPRRVTWQRFAVATLAAALVLFAGGAADGVAHRTVVSPQLSAGGARLFAIGHYYWNQRTRDGVEKSVGYFEKVIASDPHNPSGYAALASADAIMGDYGYGTFAPKVYFNRATANARMALSLDANCGAAYAALGVIAMDLNRGAEALVDLKRAVALDPSDGPSREWYGIALLGKGRLPQALHELQRAADLDPLSVSTTAWLSSAAYFDHRYDEAIAYGRQTLDLSPQRGDVWESIGLSYEAQGNGARAIQAFTRLASSCSDCKPNAAALLAHLYARAHRFAAARAELAIAQAHASDVSLDNLVIALAALGERNRAIVWLHRSHDRSLLRMEIANDPRYAAVRSDLRFSEPEQGPA